MDMKLFTLEEANALLPQLKEDLYKLQSMIEEMDDLFLELQMAKTKRNLAPAGSGPEDDPYFEQEGRLEFMKMEAELHIGNFSRRGVLIKSVSPGLLDFPATLDGKDVLLCWKQGEEQISHYHGWNDGFAGRKVLP